MGDIVAARVAHLKFAKHLPLGNKTI